MILFSKSFFNDPVQSGCHSKLSWVFASGIWQNYSQILASLDRGIQRYFKANNILRQWQNAYRKATRNTDLMHKENFSQDSIDTSERNMLSLDEWTEQLKEYRYDISVINDYFKATENMPCSSCFISSGPMKHQLCILLSENYFSSRERLFNYKCD